MADGKIVINEQLQVSGPFALTRQTSNGRFDLVGTRWSSVVQPVGLVPELVDISPALTTFGRAYFKTNHPTDGDDVFDEYGTLVYVQVGVMHSGTFLPFCELTAGESCSLRLVSGVTYYARANIEECNVEFTVLEA